MFCYDNHISILSHYKVITNLRYGPCVFQDPKYNYILNFTNQSVQLLELGGNNDSHFWLYINVLKIIETFLVLIFFRCVGCYFPLFGFCLEF